MPLEPIDNGSFGYRASHANLIEEAELISKFQMFSHVGILQIINLCHFMYELLSQPVIHLPEFILAN